jgi:hypothetical protein
MISQFFWLANIIIHGDGHASPYYDVVRSILHPEHNTTADSSVVSNPSNFLGEDGYRNCY